MPPPSTPPSPPPSDPALWKTYTYTPTEKNVFASSPYKSRLLPLWRFRTPALARTSANEIWDVFLDYERQDDFVGMDNARKFLQMGMTRAARYANHKGGRKYRKDDSGGGGRRKEREEKEGNGEEEWEGRKEKEEASGVFRAVWERAKGWEGYVERKEEFLKRQRDWRKFGGSGSVRKGKKRRRGGEESEEGQDS